MTQLNISQMARNIDTLDERVTALEESGGGSSNYNELTNRPTFNGSTIEGDITSAVESYLVNNSSAIDTLHGAISAEHDRVTTTKQDVETNAYNIEMLTGDVEDNTTNINSLDGRVTALEESGGGGSSHAYSTEEHEVGTWIDGRKVYEKTLYTSRLSSGLVSLAHGVGNIAMLLSSKSSVTVTDGGNDFYFCENSNGNTTLEVVEASSTLLYINVGSVTASLGHDYNITIEYVKAV